MKKLIISLGIVLISSVWHYSVAEEFSHEWKKTEVKKVMQAVADWQIANFDKVPYGRTNWINAVMYLGMFEWGKMAESQDKDDKYLKFLYKIGNGNGWQPDKRMYHADDICVSQMYLDMYRHYGQKNKNMLNPTIARTDWVINHPSQGSMQLNYRDGTTLERWSWCDALFMAPPVYARLYAMTGDKRYLRFMDQNYKDTYQFLFSPEDSLFFRDANYFAKQEPNGAKVFWSRGNGWVLGGLCQILDELPAKDKSRKFYENLFISLCKRIARCQQTDGYWHASLLDPGSYPAPETSGTGFFVYALAYGINQGYLPEAEYRPVVEKGWKALVEAVWPDGKLGFVQPVGESPKKVTKEMTEAYGVGAFLLAGLEIYQLSH